jgi:hypothetical protein
MNAGEGRRWRRRKGLRGERNESGQGVSSMGKNKLVLSKIEREFETIGETAWQSLDLSRSTPLLPSATRSRHHLTSARRTAKDLLAGFGEGLLELRISIRPMAKDQRVFIK